MMRIVDLFLDFIFPTSCLKCRKRDEIICTRCSETLRRAEQSTLQGGPLLCALYGYRDPVVKQLIWRLKYKGDQKSVAFCAQAVYDTLIDVLGELALFGGMEKEKPFLVPIPISRARRQKRGFNQTELLAAALVSLDQGSSFVYKKDALEKIKETPNQTSLPREERLKNPRGSFSVPHQTRVSGKNIILIDDVYTTGATLGEAARVLKSAGARKIIGVTVAH